jgi:hypothetical protein
VPRSIPIAGPSLLFAIADGTRLLERERKGSKLVGDEVEV